MADELRDAAEALLEYVDVMIKHALPGAPGGHVLEPYADRLRIALASNPAPSGGGWEHERARLSLLAKLFAQSELSKEHAITFAPGSLTEYADDIRVLLSVTDLAALSPVQPAGWRLVPEEPDIRMIADALNAEVEYSKEQGLVVCDFIDPSNHVAAMGAYQRNSTGAGHEWTTAFLSTIYRAMILAAPAASTSTTEGAG